MIYHRSLIVDTHICSTAECVTGYNALSSTQWIGFQ